MLYLQGINIPINIVLIVSVDVNSVRLKESIFEAFKEVTFVGGRQFDIAVICIFKELAKALDYCICVIEVIPNPLRLDLRVEEGS